MIRHLLFALFKCQHEDAIRVRVDGVYFLECPTCGNVSEAIARTKAERRQMAKRFPAVSPPKAQRVTKPNVEPMRKRG